jgi:pSer/pThr/pTyr-binding forkhead associated (FHA) protein
MRFEEADGEVYLYDDASTNGVRLNGKRIEPETLVKLSDGDKIRVLDITFAVRID